MTTKVISVKNRYGKYTKFEKQFNDERHFKNWYSLMTRKGNKIIGVYEDNI